MTQSTLLTLLLATPLGDNALPFFQRMLPHLQHLVQHLHNFTNNPVNPTATHDFELQLQELLKTLGRDLVDFTYNRLDTQPQPDRLVFNGESYRRRHPTPNTIATLFGSISLVRTLYENREPGNPCFFPLEQRLGIVAGAATPALADRASWWSAQFSQGDTLDLLQSDHNVQWSTTTLRKVTLAMSQALEPLQVDVEAAKVLDLLKDAFNSRGRHRPALVVGRDGIMMPICSTDSFKEGSVATVTVYNRRGKRLGTVYLSRMPQGGQGALTERLTALLNAVFRMWTGPLPRLAYVTDAGNHQASYYRKVLRVMVHPQTGERLSWFRVSDYYHAAQYLTKLSQALFGETAKASKWARRMRRRLKEKDGVKRVLQSATMHRKGQKLSKEAEKLYAEASGYLHRQRQWLNYWEYKRLGLPIGSGITEAGCKIVVTQRMKQSGMRWKAEGGQVVLTLRCLLLSDTWSSAIAEMLKRQDFQCPGSSEANPTEKRENAA